jgi:hypothetical protein
MKSERMKKWTASAVALLFGIAVIGFTIKLSYDVMAILFPNEPVLKYFAIALYDGGVIAWLTTYIGRAKGTPQRGISLLMTVLDFIGVAAMVISGIYLSGQTLADIPSWVGSTVVNVTIIAAVVNAGAIYYFHANDPQTVEEIQAQELEDTLNEEALDQARMQVERNAQMLGNIMANRVTARLKYRMRLPMTEQETSEWQGETIDAQAYDPAQLPPPPAQQETFWSSLKSFFGGKQSKRQYATQPQKNSTSSPSEAIVSIENANETWGGYSGAIMAWVEVGGQRTRHWCLACRVEGKPWDTPEPCEHIWQATEESRITLEVAENTHKKLMSEPQTEPAPYHPVSLESNYRPGDSTGDWMKRQQKPE